VTRFVSEQANPGNALGVVQVTARLHTPLLDAGVRLADTPGVGSVHEHNTASTDTYLPSLDAAVLVTSADPPISAAERAFLERVLAHAVRVFVVLNKADYLAAGDLHRTVAFTEAVVREVLPDWPGPVYPLSARLEVGDPDGLRRFGCRLGPVPGRGAGGGGDRLGYALGRPGPWVPAAGAGPGAAGGQPAGRGAGQPAGRFAAVVDRLAGDAAEDAALLGAAVRRGLEALDGTLAPHRAEQARRAAQHTLEAAERHQDAGPGRLLELLAAERPAMLEGLSRELVERAEAAAVAAYRQGAAGVAERAARRVQRLQAEAVSTFGVPLPGFVAPDLDLGIARVSFATPHVTLLAEQLASASWRLLGARAARARAIGRAREQAAEEAQMLLGWLRGVTSEQLGEAARQLGARLQRHQAVLATSLTAAVERGAGLLAEAEDHRQRRTAQLDRAANLLHQVTVGLHHEPPQPGAGADGQRSSAGRAHERRTPQP
jgi:hypothetical protein